MALLLPGFPHLPAHRIRVTLGARAYDLRLTWRERTASWYLDLWKTDGTPIALGRRLTPGWDPILGLGIADSPDDGGFGTVRGTDPYERQDLGAGLRLVWMPTAEVQAGVVAVDDGYSVTL